MDVFCFVQPGFEPKDHVYKERSDYVNVGSRPQGEANPGDGAQPKQKTLHGSFVYVICYLCSCGQAL